jgi:hypothetical protein
VGWDWVHLVRQPLIGLLYQPLRTDEYGEFAGKRIGRRNRCTHRNPTPEPFCQPKIPYQFAWDQARAVVVWSRRLTVPAKSRPRLSLQQDAPKSILTLKRDLSSIKTGRTMAHSVLWIPIVSPDWIPYCFTIWLSPAFTLVFCLVYSSTVKMGAIFSPQISVDF